MRMFNPNGYPEPSYDTRPATGGVMPEPHRATYLQAPQKQARNTASAPGPLADFAGAAGIGGLLTGLYAADRGFNVADEIREYGESLYSVDSAGNASGALPTLGDKLADNSKFQGYGVTSQLGHSSVDGSGNLSLGVNRDLSAQNNANSAYGAANTMMGKSMADPAARQQELYNQAMAVQNPQLNRMQAQQQAREYAMGRGGVRGSQFGGTAEDAAMARARADASNQAYMMAQQQGLAEQAQQAQIAGQYGQLANQYNQTSYLPMQQQMALLQLAGQDADRAQTGQLTGQGYLAQTNIGGMQAAVNSMKSASELEGNLYDSILDNVGGLFRDLF